MSQADSRKAKVKRKPDPWHENFRVYRNESGGCQGWSVTISVEGIRQSGYFGDAAYGSKEKALAAARDFAHKERELHVEYLALRRRFRPRTNTRSGIPGVARFSHRTRGDFWSAYFDDPRTGTRKMKRFSIAQFGEDAARELAIEFRTEQLEPYLKRLRELEERFLGNKG